MDKQHYIGSTSRLVSVLGSVFATVVACTYISGANAASGLDQSLFQTLSLVEESVKRISMEGNISATVGSDSLKEGRIEILGKIVDETSSTTKAQYYYKDVEVMGAMSLAHQSGLSLETENTIMPIAMDITPRLSARQAFLIAKPLVGENPMRIPPTLKILPNIDRTAAQLIYVIDFASKEMSPGAKIYIDANTGRLVANISHLESAAPITVVNAGKKKVFLKQMVQPVLGMPRVVGCFTQDPVTGVKTGGQGVSCNSIVDSAIKNKSVCQFLDSRGVRADDVSAFPLVTIPEACDIQVKAGVWQTVSRDGSAVLAYNNSKKVANYYLSVHGRDSYDGKGSPIISNVNSGFRMANAFWSSETNEMTYGAGDEEYDNFTKAVDVAGHEMTHGVVSKTAALEMMDENGALNEGISDFFGKMIEGENTWRMGVGLNKAKPDQAIRDIANPHSIKLEVADEASGKPAGTPMPAHINEKFKVRSVVACGPENDRCFVHDNSTIPSHAMYQMVQLVGKDKAEKIVYQTLTKRMTSRSNFRDTASAMKSTCAALYDSTTCGGVIAAWAKVGL